MAQMLWELTDEIWKWWDMLLSFCDWSEQVLMEWYVIRAVMISEEMFWYRGRFTHIGGLVDWSAVFVEAIS